MKLVVDYSLEGFGLSKAALACLGLNGTDFLFADWDAVRTDSRLLAFIEENGLEAAAGKRGRLAVVDIPNEATDWRVVPNPYRETVLYVLDGKIREIPHPDD